MSLFDFNLTCNFNTHRGLSALFASETKDATSYT